MIDFRSLEFFYWLARLHSFSKTARRLNTTQPSVSQRIAGLERELGVRLVDRRLRQNSLTPHGEILARYCERLLALRDEMISDIRALHPVRQTIRLGASETITRLWMRDFIEKVEAMLPGVNINMTVDVSPRMRDRLLDGELDLCFYLGASDRKLVSKPLFEAQLGFFAAPGFRLGPEPVGIEALRRLPIITYHPTISISPYLMLQKALQHPGSEGPVLIENSSLTSIIEMSLDGLGLCVVPVDIVRKELERGTLRAVETLLPLPAHSFVAAYRQDEDCRILDRLVGLAQQIARNYDSAGAGAAAAPATPLQGG
jgi:DNA-binding transcriptional LysR family regulator